MSGGDSISGIPDRDSPYRLLFESAPLPVLVYDADTLDLIDINQAAVVQYGYTRDEISHLNLRSLRVEEEMPALLLALQQAGEGASNIGTWRHRRKDGSTFPAEVISYTLNLPNRRCRVSMATDISERQELTDALNRSLREKEAMLNALPAGIAVLDGVGTIVFVNEAWTEFARGNGFHGEGAGLGLNYIEVCGRVSGSDRSDASRIAEAIREVLDRKREEFQMEYACPAPMEPRWFRAMVRPVDDGETVGAVVMHVDITDRILAEEGIKERLEIVRFESEVGEILRASVPLRTMLMDCAQAVVRSLPIESVSIWVRNPDAGVFEIRGEAGADGEGNRAFTLQKIDQAAATLESVIEDRCIALPLVVNGAAVGVLAVQSARGISDLTQMALASIAGEIALGIVRKRREEDVSRLAKAVEEMSESTVITDREGVITYTNPAFTRITGYTAAEALGKNRNILNSRTHPPEVYEDLWNTINRGETWSGRLTNRRKNGGLYQEEMTISPIRNEAGEIVNFVGVGRDVTHESELEARTRQAEKLEAVGQLASGIAHDFNNLLQVILAYSGFLLKDAEPGSVAEEDIQKIIAAGERAADLTRQLLVFSRQTEMTMGPFDIRPLIKELAKLLERTFPSSIEIRCTLPNHEDFPQVLGDPSGLNQALLSLCLNARDAMPEGGNLHIEAGVETGPPRSAKSTPGEVVQGSHIRISVADNGSGIPPEDLGRIFEPFFTTKVQGQGVGLGLSSTLGIVQQHRGFIDCRSELGEGTVFTLYLPVHEEPRKKTTWGAEESNGLRGAETLLLVDDNPMVLDILDRTFRALGYLVLTARDGREAIEKFEAENRIDLILTDIQMPKVSGVKLARHVLEKNPTTKVVFQSGFLDDTMVEEYLKSGVACVIQKPIDPIDLAGRIRETLDRENLG